MTENVSTSERGKRYKLLQEKKLKAEEKKKSLEKSASELSPVLVTTDILASSEVLPETSKVLPSHADLLDPDETVLTPSKFKSLTTKVGSFLKAKLTPKASGSKLKPATSPVKRLVDADSSLPVTTDFESVKSLSAYASDPRKKICQTNVSDFTLPSC